MGNRNHRSSGNNAINSFIKFNKKMNIHLAGLYGSIPLHQPQKKFDYWIWIIVTLIILFALIRQARAEEIDLSIIAEIESSDNPLAYNPKSGARGLYQISEVALLDYNTWHKGSEMPLISLYSPILAYKVANWYLSIRIPQMLKFYGFPCDIEHVLWAYSAGISNVRKRIKPKETRDYIKKFWKLYDRTSRNG